LRYARADVAEDLPERVILYVVVRNGEIYMVREVEELEPQLQPLVPSDVEISTHVSVNIKIAGPV
jgi:hypothetical protein